MITRRKTYKISEEDNKRELVYEDILNDDNQITAFKDYQAEPQTEGFNEYDEEGRVIMERQIMNGEESYRTEYAYDEEGDICEMKQFIADELFEHSTQEFTDDAMIKRTFRYGEEVQKIIETHKDDNHSTIEFFDAGELFETHHRAYDPVALIEKTAMFNPDGESAGEKFQQFDLANHLIKFEEHDGQGNLLYTSEHQYKGDLLISEQQQDYLNNQYFKVSYEYDDRHNMTARKVYTLSDKLLEYQKMEYDEHDRLIKESGYAVGSFDAIYGTYVNNETYLFEHEYTFEEQKVMPF